jgi:hypothetical protein
MTTGDMDRPSEGDRPGAVDDAVWTELVASFHASTADRPDLWPAAENVPEDPDGPPPAPGAGTGTGAPGPGGHRTPYSLAGDADAASTAGADADTDLSPGAHTPPSRVVRPAARPGQEAPPSAPPAVTWTASGPRDYTPDPIDEDGFVPPPPPPLPELGMSTKAAWIAGLGGPGYLALATVLHWETPQWAALLCVLAGVIGFAYLVSRLKDRPEDGEDGPDDPTYGAVL